jgi:hypothetical protein
MTKNIQNIAPLLACHFMDIESDAKAFEAHHKMLAAHANRLGLYHKYTGRLHDSRVIQTNRSEDKFSITLNDFATHVFSDVMVARKKLSIAHDQLVFPVQIDFETTNLTFNTVDEDGNIQSIEPTTISEYLYEQIISIDEDTIEIGLVVWKAGLEDTPGTAILILMRVKNIRLTTLQDDAWFAIFGNTYDDYYKYFKAQLDTGRYLSDQSKYHELYDEYETQLKG